MEKKDGSCRIGSQFISTDGWLDKQKRPCRTWNASIINLLFPMEENPHPYFSDKASGSMWAEQISHTTWLKAAAKIGSTSSPPKEIQKGSLVALFRVSFCFISLQHLPHDMHILILTSPHIMSQPQQPCSCSRHYHRHSVNTKIT